MTRLAETCRLLWALVLVGCSETAAVSPTASGPASPGGAAAREFGLVTGEHSFVGRTVLYSVGKVLLTEEGTEVRRVEFSEAGHPARGYMLPVHSSISTTYSSGGKHLQMRPKTGLTWGDVQSEADLIFEVE